MKSHSITTVCFLLFILLVLTACSTPYSTPDITPVNSEFNGLNDYLQKQQTPRLIAIHGMCHHDDAWVRSTTKRMKAFLGMVGDPPAKIVDLSTDLEKPSAELWHTSLARDTRQLEFYAIVYSGLTKDDKQKLCSNVSRKTCVCTDVDEDGTGQYRRKQASINADIKNRLMNECLSDAVIYAGDSGGRHIRQGVRDVLLTAMAGMTREKQDVMTMLSQLEAGQPPILFLSESLGSKILFDVVIDLQRQLQGDEYRGFNNLISSVSYIHMAANQIPIMRLAYDPQIDLQKINTPSGEYMEMRRDIRMDGINEMVEIIQKARESNREQDTFLKRVQVIAYTDPNDILSYELLDGSNSTEAGHTGNMTVSEIRNDERLNYVDIAVSNTSTLFTLLADPQKAHQGYLDNNEVVGRIIEGSDFSGSDYIEKLKEDNEPETCEALRQQ